MRGPTYTDEEKEFLSKLAKDDKLTLKTRVEAFFGKFDSDRTPDAVSQKLRKLRADVENMRAAKKDARKKGPESTPEAKEVPAAAAAPSTVPPRTRRPTARRGVSAAKTAPAASTNGNGHGHVNGNGHKSPAVSEASVQLGAVRLSGPAGEVGKMLQQLAS